METKAYKIRNKEGLFSTGGGYPRWTKNGKVWNSRGAVMGHLTMFNPTSKVYQDAEIVELIISTVEGTCVPVTQELERLKVNKDVKKQKREEKYAAQRLAYAQKEVERAQTNLKKLLENSK